MGNLPQDGSGKSMQVFKPHPSYINKDNSLAAINLTTVPLEVFHCHTDGSLTCTTAVGAVTIPCVEGMQWAFPESTTAVEIVSGTFSFM